MFYMLSVCVWLCIYIRANVSVCMLASVCVCDCQVWAIQHTMKCYLAVNVYGSSIHIVCM